jgi:putative heme transporter
VLVVRGLASLGMGVGLVVVVIPKLAGGRWAQIDTTLEAVTIAQLATLAVLWAFGLIAHSTTLAAAMPRLGRRRALVLSLTGSAVSNVLPFGGVAGVALNYRMSRQWGFDRAAFGAYTVVTNLWDVLVRLSLPAVALTGLILTGYVGVGRLAGTATAATLTLTLVVLAGVAILGSRRVTKRLGAGLDRLVRPLLGVLRIEREIGLERALVALRTETNQLVRSAWPRLTFGVVAYAMLLAALLWACLHITGAGLAVPAVLAGLALERVATMVPITPGGAGLVEVGISGLLIALGGDQVGTVSGVLLYRAFTYGLEIPVGGVGIAAWLWLERTGRRPAVATGPTRGWS